VNGMVASMKVVNGMVENSLRIIKKVFGKTVLGLMVFGQVVNGKKVKTV
jgi:hypothetical protein